MLFGHEYFHSATQQKTHTHNHEHFLKCKQLAEAGQKHMETFGAPESNCLPGFKIQDGSGISLLSESSILNIERGRPPGPLNPKTVASFQRHQLSREKVLEIQTGFQSFILEQIMIIWHEFPPIVQHGLPLSLIVHQAYPWRCHISFVWFPWGCGTNALIRTAAMN